MPRVRASRAVESTSNQVFSAIEHVPADFAICDAEGRLQAMSRSFAQRFAQDGGADVEAAFARAIRSASEGVVKIEAAGADFTLTAAPGAALWTIALASAPEFASRDALNGLPDRAGLRQRMSDILADAQRHARTALLLLDLDRFKSVNDTLGHPFGDKLLRKVVERIRHSLGEDAFVCRLGGDEFAILIEADDVR